MRQNRKIIYFAGFLFSIPVALVAYVNSSFVSSFVGEKFVSLVYVLASATSVLSLLLAPKLFKRFGGYKFLLGAAFFDALSFLILSFAHNTLWVILVFILGFSLNILIFFSLDELLKILSPNVDTGKIRGIYLVIINLAWVLAQLLQGTILGNFSFKEIYFVAFLITILFFLASYYSFKNIPEPQYDKISSLKFVKKFFREKNLARAYGINFLLQFFYVWMIVYTPIYLYSHLGFSWEEIGIIFAVMLLPFIFVPLFTGEIADKIGERKILMFGFAIASLSTISLFFVHQHLVWIWAILLFTTRIGASSLDGTSDAYFFKHIRPENEELVGVYRSASPVAYILGPIAAFLIFIFIPSFNYLFIILGMLMLYGVYLSSTIRKDDI